MTTSPISSQAAAAREGARNPNGKFGHQPLDSTNMELGQAQQSASLRIQIAAVANPGSAPDAPSPLPESIASRNPRTDLYLQDDRPGIGVTVSWEDEDGNTHFAQAWEDGDEFETNVYQSDEATQPSDQDRYALHSHVFGLVQNASSIKGAIDSAVVENSDVKRTVLALAAGRSPIDDLDGTPSADRGAERGMAMLRIGTDAGGDAEIWNDEEEAETAVADALANLQLACEWLGVDFDEALRRGRGYFEEEMDEKIALEA